MDERRRAMIGAMGIGVAGLALGMPAVAAAQPPLRRRMIVRADDIGFSEVCNIGSFEAIAHGVVTSADVMLDSPGTVDALERLKAMPWISLGWHMHMWGAPVLGPARVPSLVETDGPFAGRFRGDLTTAADVDQDQAVAELSAQLDRCQRILGRLPGTGDAPRGDTPWGRAVRKVGGDAGIAFDFMAKAAPDPAVVAAIGAAQRAGEGWAANYPTQFGGAVPAAPEWAARKIVSLSPLTAYRDLLTDSVSHVEAAYDPVLYYTQDRAGILSYPVDVVTEQSWHPGYVDYYVYRLGERFRRARAQQFVVGRVQDVAAMCDPRLKNWIRTNRIELVSLGDALRGTDSYQAHLRSIGSDLATL